MFVKEYRIILPITVEEYQRAQLYTLVHASRNETGGGEGVQFLQNEPFANVPLFNGQYSAGQYTHKTYYIKSKVPGWLRKIAPSDLFHLDEEAWNAHPYCKTVITNPDYMKQKFFINIESIHLPDRGTTDNALQLSPEMLAKREVIIIDIAKELADRADYKEEYDPRLFQSKKTGRGPLKGEWYKKCTPVMCCYKLVVGKFQWLGFQTVVENFLKKMYPRMFAKFHRELFCSIDQWHGLTMEDIRRLEEEARRDLEQQRNEGAVRGMRAE